MEAGLTLGSLKSWKRSCDGVFPHRPRAWPRARAATEVLAGVGGRDAARMRPRSSTPPQSRTHHPAAPAPAWGGVGGHHVGFPKFSEFDDSAGQPWRRRLRGRVGLRADWRAPASRAVAASLPRRWPVRPASPACPQRLVHTAAALRRHVGRDLQHEGRALVGERDQGDGLRRLWLHRPVRRQQVGEDRLLCGRPLPRRRAALAKDEADGGPRPDQPVPDVDPQRGGDRDGRRGQQRRDQPARCPRGDQARRRPSSAPCLPPRHPPLCARRVGALASDDLLGSRPARGPPRAPPLLAAAGSSRTSTAASQRCSPRLLPSRCRASRSLATHRPAPRRGARCATRAKPHARFADVASPRRLPQGVQRFVHVSALGASLDSPSKWAVSKFLGEKEVKDAFT